MRIKKSEGYVFVVIILVGALITTALLGGIYYLLPDELKEGYNRIDLPKSNPMYGDIFTDRSTDTLKVTFNAKTNTLTLADYHNHAGGNFKIKNAKEHFSKDSIQIIGNNYQLSETAKNDVLNFYIPHFSLVEITPIYAGIYYMGQHETVTEKNYAIYCDSTFTNATMHFKGYEATVSPYLIIDDVTYRYDTTLANGTFYNMSIPLARFTINATNQIKIGTEAGGLQWVLRGDRVGYNITWDFETLDFSLNDEVEYQNITLTRYFNIYTTIPVDVWYNATVDYAISGDHEGSYVNVSGPGQFNLTEGANHTHNILPQNKSVGDTTADILSDIRTINQSGVSPTAVILDDGWYTIDRNLRMYIDDFNISSTIAHHNNITAVQLYVKYSVETGYTGNNDIRWRLDGDVWNTTGITPTNGQIDEIATFDLFAVGVNSTDEIKSLDIDFINNDGGLPNDAVSFDYLAIILTSNQTTNVSAKHSFGTFVFPTNTTQITACIYANFTSGSSDWGVGLSRNINGSDPVAVGKITSDVSRWYEFDVTTSIADGDNVYFLVGGELTPTSVTNHTLYVDSYWINYTYQKGVIGNFSDKNITIPLKEVTHHHEVINITYDATTNLSWDSTNFYLNETANTLTVTLPTIAKATNTTLNITILNVFNDGPVFTSRPLHYATIDWPYAYVSVVTDIESDSVTYDLVTDASFLKINATTGNLRGTPDIKGNYVVRIYANDSKGGSTYQEYNLTVMGNPISFLSDFFDGMFTGGITIAGLGTLAMICYYAIRIGKIRSGKRRSDEELEIKRDNYNLTREYIKARIKEISNPKKKSAKAPIDKSNLDTLILHGKR